MPGTSAEVAIHAVDLFCGIGGLTHGLSRSGITVKAGFDIDESCRHAYEANNRGSQFVPADIRDLKGEHLQPYFAGATTSVLVGCAPCQPFSAHNRKLKRETDCSLLYEFARLIEETQPDLVSMENVPGLAKHQAFADFLALLHRLHYHPEFDIVCCSDYGVPQKRRRLVLLASQIGPIALPKRSTGTPTVSDFIADLPPISDGQTSFDDPAHVAMPLTDINKRRIQQSKPGGTWKDWDKALLSPCHRTSYYPAPYGRMQWDDLAPTITTQFCYYSTGRFGHPEQDRAISVREAALLQTFPSDYEFFDKTRPLHVRDAARHIGNAVPVKLGEAIGASFLEAAHVD